MRHQEGCGVVALVMALSFSAAGADVRPTAAASAFPRLLYAAEGAQKILRYASDGTIDWEYPAEMSRDVWQLPNGNVLFCFNRNYHSQRHDNPSGVMEVTPDRRIAFSFSTTGQVWSCQRLLDGTTLVGAASQGCLLLVDPKGDVIRKIPVKNAPGHSCMRHARQLPNGHFLVAEESARAVREYAPDGKMTREINVGFPPFSAVRLANGNTVICGQQWIVEIDAEGRSVWSLSGSEIPQAGIRWFAGIQVLPDGHLFVCNAGGRVTFLEIDRSKKIVWQSHTGPSPYPAGHGIYLLTAPAAPGKRPVNPQAETEIRETCGARDR